MEIECRVQGCRAIFVISGRIDFVGAEPLRRQFKESLAQGFVHFLFDLRELLYLDSASIGDMVACLKEVSERSGSVRLLVREGDRIDEVMRLSGVHDVFEVFYDPDEAVLSPGG